MVASDAAAAPTTAVLKWTKIDAVAARNSELPSRRSGHTLSIIGSNGFLFGGCDYKEPPGPTNDLFVLRINTSAPCEWEKLKILQTNTPLPRWKHSATVVDGKIYVFGGFHNSTTRFNDVWVFNPITMDWSQPGAQALLPTAATNASTASSVPTPSSSATASSSSSAGGAARASVSVGARNVAPVVPAPRGGHSAVLIRRAIYVFGGYGGAGYARRDFDDLFMFRVEDATWSKVATKGKAPERRAGHQACAVDDVMLVCGGWNSVVQFNDLHVLDTTTGAWSTVDGPHMASTLPRWNHASCAVLAIPHAKVFVFGGVLGEPNNYNAQGTFMNDLAVLETGDWTWHAPEIRGTPPCGRADTTLAYDDKGSRLLVFGGWANVWLDDLFALDVSCVVGPPYGITAIFPDFGPITGGTTLTIEGIDFVNRPVIVRFASRGGGALDVAGEFVNDHTLRVVTPDFSAHPAGDVQVRIAIQGDSFTTTFQTFCFFAVTAAATTFAFGPGVLRGGAAGDTTSFIIQARDANRGLRTRGGDEFSVELQSAGDGAPLFLPDLVVQDLQNGRYLVSFTTPKAGEYDVVVTFQGTFGGAAGPIRGSPFRVSFDDAVTREMNVLTGKLVVDQLLSDLQTLATSTRECLAGLDTPLADPTWTPEQVTNALIALKEHVFHVEKRGARITTAIDELRVEIDFLRDAGVVVSKESEMIAAVERMWLEIQKRVPAASQRIAPLIATQSVKFRQEMDAYAEELTRKETALRQKPFWSFAVGVKQAQDLIAAERTAFQAEQTVFARKQHIAEILECDDVVAPCQKTLYVMQRTLDHVHSLWESIADVTRKIDLSREIPWSMIDGVVLEEEAKAFMTLVKSVHKEIRDCDAFKHFERLVREFLSTCPLFQALRHPSMRRRHWLELVQVTGKTFEIPDDNPSLKFADILELNLHAFQRDVEEITDRAQKEAKQESLLQDLEARWANVSFAMATYRETDVPLLHLAEDAVEMLESDQLLLQSMLSGRYNFFQAQTERWHATLMQVADVLAVLNDIQRAWSYLEPLFMGSEEVKRELPEQAAAFQDVDARVRTTLRLMWSQQSCGNVLMACQLPDLLRTLGTLRSALEAGQQALKEYLDAKRRLFPRFYFISEADLLDLLSKGSQPESILVHLEKVFLATHTLVLVRQQQPNDAQTVTHFISKDLAPERVALESPLELEGKVELYLQTLHEAMRATLKEQVARSSHRFPEQNRVDWLMQKLPVPTDKAQSQSQSQQQPMDAAQIALLVAGIEYVKGVEQAFSQLAHGRATAMKEYFDKVVIQLNDLIKLTQTALTREDRQRVMCLITMDAHARDIVHKLLYEQITTASSFLWQSQLKQRRHETLQRTTLEICDASFDYGFEYLGNGARLVITPLTDRIYVTATQALHMQMGCAPAGPAGTGKTETTKDLANMVGKACYVFNCSPEMDYKNLGNIFKGLASAGAWGCFDEFNRLAPEVLSVCSVQFKAVCDAIRADSEHVTIEGDRVTLDATCGTFITMNPGYLGRSELPEGLKALFRPITVMAPDLVLICENMLMAEGFKDAKILASKFFSLYSLLRELLSKQDHYDWGLRAVKSVLVVAGAFKRSEPKLSEHEILMRALRDFNLPKIVEQDLLVFNGLLGDLFPALNPPRKVDEAMERHVQVACEELHLWPHEQFRLKVVQLEELLAIRHCVFVMGPPGSGKTECRDTLMTARKKKGDEYLTRVVDLNPKAVSTEELYGYMVLGTREWKDGLLSKLMRDVATASTTDPRPRWIVLDGDLDANWIESMNSVMDDNKMLTLASNERIPLKPNMRLLFEIRDLVYATPATVSRAGILYISDDDGFQWKSLLASWVGAKTTSANATPAQRALLGETVARYIDASLPFVRQQCKTIVPVQDITLVQTYLYFLDAVLPLQDGESAALLRDAKKLDVLCAFLSIWAFGATLTIADDGTDYRRIFSEWWRSEFKGVKLPARDAVFDYWLNPTTMHFDSWRASPFFRTVQFDGSVPMSSITVPTTETAAISNWMSLMVREHRPFMLCGSAGTGKTQLVQGLLASIDSPPPQQQQQQQQKGAATTPAATLTLSSLSVNFNFYTNAASLQTILESKLAKRMGNTFGPATGGQLLYFLDDLNLPQVDAYNTQSAIALLRQHLDYGHWYDRQKLTLKQIQHVQFLSCMNPNAGSFVVNPRLQRHFVTFALAQLSVASLQTIYTTFLEGYVADFVEEIRKLTPQVLKAALSLHAQVSATFRKTAANFHYEFNIRHIANVFQGLLLAKPSTFEDPFKFALLWIHESTRVYGDRLVSAADLAKFTTLLQQQARKCFPSFNFTKHFVSTSASASAAAATSNMDDVAMASAPPAADAILFCHFANGLRTNEYDQVTSLPTLLATVEDALAEHNELYTKMDLVLFRDALEHITRIVRILSNPSGHAMLVGVGGSGRKSLARLAAFICGFSLSEIVITQSYSLLDFKADLQAMFLKAGVRSEGLVFLLTDSQIKHERMLVLMNDLLSSGNVPDLFNVDEQSNIVQQVLPRMKAAMANNSNSSSANMAQSNTSEKELCWQYFVQEIKRNLHVVLCFSPATAEFRSRARKFPALVSCTFIDWFQPWPRDALFSVAARFLDVDEGSSSAPAFDSNGKPLPPTGLLRCIRDDDHLIAIQRFMPFAFQSTNDVALELFAHEKRRVYTTPKSYLECLMLYKGLLLRKHDAHERAMARLKSGLDKMEVTRDVVANMEQELQATLEQAEKKKVLVEEIALRLQHDKAIVEKETAKANIEKEKCAVIQAEVSTKRADTEADLLQAQPMVEAAMAALDTLNKKDLGSCKTMTKPPAGVGDIFGAVVVLLAGVNPNVIVQKNGKVKDKDRSWEACKKALLSNVNAFVDELKSFKSLVDDQQVPEVNWKEVRPFLQLEHFNVEAIEKKNSAAAGLCAWVINIVAYYDAIVVVEPKKKALAEANEKLRLANEKLDEVQSKVDALEAKLSALTTEFEQTNRDVQDAIAAVEKGRLRIQLATRLTAALGSESARWASDLEVLQGSAEMLIGDVLIAASFVSYIGGFTKPYRDLLINEQWIPFLRKAVNRGGSGKNAKREALPMSEVCNPLQILATDSEIAEWNTRGLPSDRVSIENGAIVRNSTRWPLLVDPQLQGVYWLREMEKFARRATPTAFQVVRQDQQNLPQVLETAIENGYSLLVENMGEKVEVSLWPVISRLTTTRGHKKLLKLGDKLVELHPDFRLYLHTKLSNPHYPPELQAETTMINFAVTQQGLEDQLLALVVRKEWPKKAKARVALIHQQNEFKIRVQALEDRILTNLADAEGDVTENVQLITDLETTKATAVEIAQKAAKAREYEAQITSLSLKYQSVAWRGALLFFLMDALNRMHSYYVYSLNAFVVIFQRGIDLVSAKNEASGGGTPGGGAGGGGGLLGRLKAAAKKIIATQRFQWNADLLLADRVVDAEQDLDALLAETDKEEMLTPQQIEARCTQLKTSITEVVFNYIRRGLFEKDKLTLATQLCFAILQAEQKIQSLDVHQLITNASAADVGSGMGLLSEWMSEATWLRIRKLEETIPSFQKLTTYMRSDCEEWKEWYDAEKPELKPMPGPYKTNVTPMQLLQIVRVLRPDRMIAALQGFLAQYLGLGFINQPPFDMEAAYQETSASTPMFFVLFPGVDPTSWIENLGRKFDFTYERGNLVNISMGQGQEANADATLLRFSREGNWVILQNIHLMQSWLPKLERTLELCSVSADQNFRCFLSAETPALATLSNIPESLLQSCIKVANEAPTDLKSNLRRAWAQFSAKSLESCAQPNEYQGCLFALCFFHALVLGRRRFGYQGWSRMYSFNTGDLLICSDVLRRYLDTAAAMKGGVSLPWDDLRYIFGEIMYGGHITDHWDRITNNTYLSEIFTPEILKGKALTAGFKCPDIMAFTYSKYATYIESELPAEAPNVYGLHPNAEIGYLMDASNELFLTISKFATVGMSTSTAAQQSSVTSSGGGGGGSSAVLTGPARENARVLGIVESLLERLPPEIDLVALQARAAPLLTAEQSPFVVVALQEASRMHRLMKEIQETLVELTKGIHGTLNMTEPMEDLMEALSINQVPGRNILHHCSWERLAWWSRKSLGLWFADLLERIQFLQSWTSEFRLPYSMWLSGLFNPTAFLTAIKQTTARRHGLPLDSLTIETHCTTMVGADAAEFYPEMGAFVHGLFLEGGRWEPPMKDSEKTSPFSYEVDGVACGGHLADPMPKELFPETPVLYARAVTIDDKWEATGVGYFRRSKDVFDCPVYQTTLRGPTYVFLATLHTVDPKAKWTLAGLALVMQRDT